MLFRSPNCECFGQVLFWHYQNMMHHTEIQYFRSRGFSSHIWIYMWFTPITSLRIHLDTISARICNTKAWLHHDPSVQLMTIILLCSIIPRNLDFSISPLSQNFRSESRRNLNKPWVRNPIWQMKWKRSIMKFIGHLIWFLGFFCFHGQTIT